MPVVKRGKEMDWTGLFVNVAAIFIGLAFYLGISHTKWGEKHREYQYAVMLGAILAACVVAGMLRVLVGMLV